MTDDTVARRTGSQSAMLVDQLGLGPRSHGAGATGTIAVGLLRLLRLVNLIIQRYFPHLLLFGIAIAAVAIYLSGGATLVGRQIRNALVLGAIYALIAIGYTMVYGIIELINFAHGDVFALSGFYSLFISTTAFGGALGSLATGHGGVGLVLALVVIFTLTMAAAGVTGMAIEFVAYRRLRDAPRLAPLITAIGVSFLLSGLLLVTQGPDNKPTHNSNWITGNAFSFGGITVQWKQLFVVVVALALMFSLGAFVRITKLGKAMRATAQDRSAALLCGINVNRTISATFFIGSALAAAGAIVYTINYNSIQWNLGYHLGIIAFTAAVLGGIGNIVGAGVGGFLIGIIYVFGGQLAGGQWSESLIFGILVIILTFRPVGLFGVDVTTRA